MIRTHRSRAGLNMVTRVTSVYLVATLIFAPGLRVMAQEVPSTSSTVAPAVLGATVIQTPMQSVTTQQAPPSTAKIFCINTWSGTWQFGELWSGSGYNPCNNY